MTQARQEATHQAEDESKSLRAHLDTLSAEERDLARRRKWLDDPEALRAAVIEEEQAEDERRRKARMAVLLAENPARKLEGEALRITAEREATKEGLKVAKQGEAFGNPRKVVDQRARQELKDLLSRLIDKARERAEDLTREIKFKQQVAWAIAEDQKTSPAAGLPENRLLMAAVRTSFPMISAAEAQAKVVELLGLGVEFAKRVPEAQAEHGAAWEKLNEYRVASEDRYELGIGDVLLELEALRPLDPARKIKD